MTLNPGLKRRDAIAKWIYQARGNRPELVREGLFADPAWDILLDTYVQNASDRPVSITSACIASRVPPTTALRWITLLEQDGWLERIEDSVDRRRSFIELSALGKSKLDRYLDDISAGIDRFSPADDYQPDTECIRKLNANIERLLAVLGDESASDPKTGFRSIFGFQSVKAPKPANSKTEALFKTSDDSEDDPSAT